MFGAIYELHHTGAKNLTLNTIDSWFQNKPTEYGVYNAASGAEYIKSLIDAADVSNFDYYYNRLKKMSLLRGYVKAGVNVDWLYDEDDFTENKAKQDKAIDRMSLTDMADLIDNKIEIVKDECVNGIDHDSIRIGDGIENLLNVLADTPEVGASFIDPVYTAITRGARKGKYYLRSAPTGIGKTRFMIADACALSCEEFYNSTTQQWQKFGNNWPTLYISTELELSEVQTMALSFITGINEEDFLLHRVDFNSDIVQHGMQILSEAPLYIEVLTDFTVRDIENTTRRNYRMHGIQALLN